MEQKSTRKEYALKHGYKICERCGKYFESSNFMKKFCSSNLRDKTSCAWLAKVEYHLKYWPKYRKENKKLIAEKNKAWHQKNRAKILRRMSEWFKKKWKNDRKFRERYLKKGKKFRESHKEYYKQKGIEWRKAHPNYYKK